MVATLSEIVKAYETDSVSEVYNGNIEITDLKEDLGTKGHLLVVRGDKAYEERLGDNAHLSNPKFWLYEHLLKQPHIQEALRQHPNYKLFDGTGFSGLEALGYHAKELGREAIAVMAHEMIPDPSVKERWPVTIVHGEGPAEQGYVEKQAEILSKRKDLIPLHQALYGSRALSPIGNAVAQRLKEEGITPDESYWCIASGSNLYGIGRKIQQENPQSKVVAVEPDINRTIPQDLDLDNEQQVKRFASSCLRDYTLEEWVSGGRKGSGIFPLHMKHINRYLLVNWARTGKTSIDDLVEVSPIRALETQERLASISPEYDWTKTTALTLTPAIESAKQGKNVVVMAYGKNRRERFRDTEVQI